MPQRPNILWYCTDQQRFDTIGALGNPHVHTPTLDGMVRQGTAFTHAFCQSPICLPSRASFMTGRYPSAVHVNYNSAAYFPKAAEATLISHLLAEAGYHCGLVGKLHLADGRMRPEPRVDDGFAQFEWSLGPFHDLSRPGTPEWEPGVHAYEQWLREQGQDPAALLRRRPVGLDRLRAPGPENDNVCPELHQTTWCSEAAMSFIREARSPWMLCVNPYDPHPDFDPPWEFFRRYDPPSLPGPYCRETDLAQQRKLSAVTFARQPENTDLQQLQVMQAAYYAMIELIDEQFGRILRMLDETGARDNTIVLFTSDHGEMLGDHGLTKKGCRFYEGLVRVPLVWSWPGRIKTNLQSDALVELTDIAPTLLALAGVGVPQRVQGRSLLPILEGRQGADEHRQFVRCEYLAAQRDPENTSFATMYRDRRWKLSVYHNHDLGELYDLAADSWEFDDRWDDPKYADIKHDLLRRSFDATVLAADPGPPRRLV